MRLQIFLLITQLRDQFGRQIIHAEDRRLPVGTERPGDPQNLVPLLYLKFPSK